MQAGFVEDEVSQSDVGFVPAKHAATERPDSHSVVKSEQSSTMTSEHPNPRLAPTTSDEEKHTEGAEGNHERGAEEEDEGAADADDGADEGAGKEEGGPPPHARGDFGEESGYVPVSHMHTDAGVDDSRVASTHRQEGPLDDTDESAYDEDAYHQQHHHPQQGGRPSRSIALPVPKKVQDAQRAAEQKAEKQRLARRTVMEVLASKVDPTKLEIQDAPDGAMGVQKLYVRLATTRTWW